MKKKHLFVCLLLTIAAVAYGATTYTTNYELAKPGDGDENYGEALRDNFDTIDTQLKVTADSITDHNNDTVDAHDSTAISTNGGPNLCPTSTTVEAYLDCLDGTFDPTSSSVVLTYGAQTITGVKTFAATPIFSAAVGGILNTNGSGVISASSFTSLSPLTTRGDLITRDASTAVRVGIGAANTVLQSDGIDPAWGAIVNANVDAAAAVARSKLASGTADHVLINNGAGVMSSEATLSPVRGGTGVANNAAATLTRSGNHALTLTTTGVTSVTLPTSGTLATLSNTLGDFSSTTSAQLATTLSNETGTGLVVFNTSPTLVTPDLDTPSAIILTNGTGLPISTGVSGLGAGVATFLGTPSTANLAAAVTGETGTGAVVFATSPTLVTPALGTPSSATLTNATGLPIATGVSGLAANVATFLGTSSSANLAAALTDETGTGAAVFGTTPTIGTPIITGGTIDNTTIGGVTRGAGNFTTVDGNSSVEGQFIGYDGVAGAGYVYMQEQSVTPSTPGSGFMRLYPKSDNKLYFKDDSGTETQVGAGTGGELNLVESPSDTNGWTTTGANGPTGTTTTTAGDLPLAGTIDTAIKMTSATAAGAEASNYFSYPLAPGNGLFSRKLKIEVWMRPGTNFLAGDWTVSVYSGATRMALSTDSGGFTTLPNLTGKFTSTFDADTSSAYTLRFARPTNAGANAAVLNVAAIVVGPGTSTQGAALSEWASYTPVWAATGTAVAIGNGTNNGRWRRVGDTMEIVLSTISGTTTTYGTGSYSWSIPTGYTIDTTKMASSTATTEPFGVAAAESTTTVYTGDVTRNTTTTVQVYSHAGTTSWAQTVPFTPAGATAGQKWELKFTVPISEWSGAGTVNVVQNDVEYVFNTNTADATDTTSFGYGSGGVAIGSFTAQRSKRVRFQTPIQQSDTVIVEINDGNGWINPNAATLGYVRQNATEYGISSSTQNSTDVNVTFYTYAQTTGATFAAAGNAWSTFTAFKWRVKKMAGGQAVGFGAASSTSAGLLSYYAESTWTPALAAASGATSGGTIVGRYIRIGSKVWATALISGATKNTLTGAGLRITGLPFTSNSTSGFQSGCAVGQFAGVTYAANTVITYRIGAGDTNINLQDSATNGGAIADTNASVLGAGAGAITIQVSCNYSI